MNNEEAGDGPVTRPAPPGRGLPVNGEPRTWVSGPRGDRLYGEDGLPETDVDWGHDHGQGRPHSHDWGRDQTGKPVRGEGRPSTEGEREISEGERDPETGQKVEQED